MSLVWVFVQVIGVTGLGLWCLKILRLTDQLNRSLMLALAFALGVGSYGWILFFFGVTGLFQSRIFIGLLIICSTGIWIAWKPGETQLRRLGLVGTGLLILIAAAGLMDIVESLTPPADGDSLAYHYNIPKMFIEQGGIVFIKQAFDGAIPLLTHLTYTSALSIGGEQTLVWWSMVTGWGTGALLYTLARQYLTQNWALAITLLYLTVPATVFAGGTGHVEVRLGLFALTAAWAVAHSLRTDSYAGVIIAGMAAGFYAGTKILGLFFALAVGLVILLRKQWFRYNLIFTITAVLVGFQWYFWNWLHTGDPVFPLLFDMIGKDDLDWWPKAFNDALKARYFGTEVVISQNLWNLVVYPFQATFNSIPLFESKRTGFGPFGALVLPIVLYAVWKYRAALWSHELRSYALLALLFYAIWFLWGPSQRIRHLLPVLPLFLLCITFAAVKVAERATHVNRVLVAAVAFTAVLQLGGHAFFTLKHVRFLVADNPVQEYLSGTVVNYRPVPWINDNLGPDDRILLSERQVLYYLKVPYFFAGQVASGAVDLAADQNDASRFYSQLRRQNITHLLIERENSSQGAPFRRPYNLLDNQGCLIPLKTFASKRFASRTLPNLSVSSRSIYEVVKLGDRACLAKRP